MYPIGAMSDRAGEGNRHPASAVEVGAVPLKIVPVVAYIVSMAVRLCICTGLTPILSNGGGRLSLAAVVPVA